MFDVSASAWTASIYVNGVLEASGSDTVAADVVTAIAFYAAHFGTISSLGYPNVFGQIIVYDDATADLAAAINPDTFVTRVIPNADGTNVGTWTPSTGSDDYAVVDPPIDATTYTQEASPSVNDRVEVLTNAGGASLTTALGLTPSSIYGAVRSMAIFVGTGDHRRSRYW